MPRPVGWRTATIEEIAEKVGKLDPLEVFY